MAMGFSILQIMHERSFNVLVLHKVLTTLRTSSRMCTERNISVIYASVTFVLRSSSGTLALLQPFISSILMCYLDICFLS